MHSITETTEPTDSVMQIFATFDACCKLRQSDVTSVSLKLAILQMYALLFVS